MLELEVMQKMLHHELDEYRYQHTLGVMYTAASMAMCYGIDLNQALVAGLLHDCAKCIPDNKKIEICSEKHISLTETELKNTALIHPKLGAYYANTLYGVKDQQILDAIRYHTTGRPEMTVLEKIIFIADYIEPGRTTAPNLPEIRKKSFENLDLAMYQILFDTLQYLKNKGGVIDEMTEKTYQYYKGVIEHGTGNSDGKTCI